MKTDRKTIIIAASTLAAGLLFGWLIFGGADSSSAEEHDHEVAMESETTWTCSMHPQIRQEEPGDCPLCGMDLIPLEEDEGEGEPMAIRMSPTAMQLAGVSTLKVTSAEAVKSIRLTGKVQADERLVHSQSSHIPGRIEQLKVAYTGAYVRKGDAIASIYSPELTTAQEELFEAQKTKETVPRMFNAAKEKLKNWKLTEAQIDQLLQEGTAREAFDIHADVSGYVVEKKVNRGDYVRTGEALYEIADLSRVWVLFDLYESDVSWVKKGDTVDFTVGSLPGESFEGTIVWIDPVIDPRTRVARARVEFNNSSMQLKPEMFVTGTVAATLPDRSESIAVPKSAVMWTGKRSLVYVRSNTDQGVSFVMREVTLGPALGDSYIIESGLQEGEEIAVSGTFSIDAAAQLAGKPSMMSPEGGPVMTGHDHGGSRAESGGGVPDHEESGTMEVPERQENTDPEFKVQLTTLYEEYLEMNSAFVTSEGKDVKDRAGEVKAALDKVDMGLLKGDAHMVWMDQLKILEETINVIAGSSDIETQRAAYVKFNPAFYSSIKAFGLNNTTTYYQYCPMANDDNGAYWLSDTDEILNPYFGDMMLKCGETKETIR